MTGISQHYSISWAKVFLLLSIRIFILSFSCQAGELVTDEAGNSTIAYKTKVANSADPFPNDGYEYPTLYEEADDMLDISMLMYPLASLRKRAREIPSFFFENDAETILKEPVSVRELHEAIYRNKDRFGEILDNEELALIDNAIGAIVERQVTSGPKSRCLIRQVGDDNSMEELVYAILVDHALKRVVVVFRGSATVKDFLTDAQLWIDEIDNPLKRFSKKQPEKLGIHNGFRGTLCLDSYYATASIQKLIV